MFSEIILKTIKDLEYDIQNKNIPEYMNKLMQEVLKSLREVLRNEEVRVKFINLKKIIQYNKKKNKKKFRIE